ncbi:hypothetical protein PLICRDRAFT_33456 [Plicaturopsis crispa FD-325 SS-3]|nr:hypothetical protein PLICRDRAFT_33456 [Plicaturopsis crispa FD-325 SS-3]
MSLRRNKLLRVVFRFPAFALLSCARYSALDTSEPCRRELRAGSTKPQLRGSRLVELKCAIPTEKCDHVYFSSTVVRHMT